MDRPNGYNRFARIRVISSAAAPRALAALTATKL